MPMGYDAAQRNITTNGTGNTETVRWQLITGSQKPSAVFTGMFAQCAGSVAGGGLMQASTFATAGSVGSGTAVTLNKKNSNNAAAGTVYNNNSGGALTGGSSTRSPRCATGFAQTGGQGGWIAITPDMGITLVANGGANGYLEGADLANAATQTFNYQIELSEN